MNNTVGYDFYFYDQSESNQLLVFPITPSELKVSIGSKNEVVTLINEGDINILKSPSLTEIEFEARFPSKKYPFSRETRKFEEYFNIFKNLKENKSPFRFVMIRQSMSDALPGEVIDFGSANYNVLVALEKMEVKEDADEGDDILIEFNLKQYKPYTVKFLQKKENTPTTTSSSTTAREVEKATTDTSYTVKSGDCLWLIAKNFYGNGASWKTIYEANKNIIESTAKKYGRASSSNGWWIYPGTKLTIPSNK